MAECIDALSDDDTLAMSFITWAEPLRGAEGSQRRQATLQQLESLRRLVLVLYPQGPAICQHYAVQAAALKRRATPIGASLVSHNVGEFSRVDGLQLANWAA